jgi:4-amino-4-deoxy-L-arabinose transferase-like glycosyltransferase
MVKDTCVSSLSDRALRVPRFLSAHKLALVLLLCIVVRLGVLVLFNSYFAYTETGVIHGSDAYDAYAQNLLETNVYGRRTPGVADAYIPPLYGYILAGVYSLFGRSYLPVVLLHIVLDCASITFLYHLCKRLFPHGAWVGMLAGTFYAIYPYLIFQNLTQIDTPIFMSLLYAFLLLAVLLRERPKLDAGAWGIAALAGVVLGFMALSRPNALIVAPLVGVWFLFRRSIWQSVVRLLPVAFVSVLVVLPWVIRNYGLYGTFVPVALNGGANFYQGNNEYVVPYFNAGYDVQWVPSPDVGDIDPFGPEANMLLMNAGLSYLREHPEAIPELLWTKFLVHWSIDITPLRNPIPGEMPRIDYQGDVIAETDAEGALSLGGLPPGDPVGEYSGETFAAGRIVHRYYYGALFILALFGIAVSLPQWREVSLLWLVQLGMMLVFVLFHPSTRYRVPTDPLLFAFSAYALVWLWLAIRRRSSHTLPTHTAEQAS